MERFPGLSEGNYMASVNDLMNCAFIKDGKRYRLRGAGGTGGEQFWKDLMDKRFFVVEEEAKKTVIEVGAELQEAYISTDSRPQLVMTGADDDKGPIEVVLSGTALSLHGFKIGDHFLVTVEPL